MISKRSITSYIRDRFGSTELIEFEVLGAGTHGAGFSLKFRTREGIRDYVIKNIDPHGLGHDYPSDRAAVFLLAQKEYENLPGHVRAVDVIAFMPDGSIRSVGGGDEYYLIMERAGGINYFTDLDAFKGKRSLTAKDREKISTMVNYLASIHSVKRQSVCLYWRKIRDTIGHGECLMGVFDSYPGGTMDYRDMGNIEKKCIDWRVKLKPLTHRLSQIHGDFHPGNIWFHDDTFTLLDRSRGPWGDPADDVTALTINYLFFSLRHHGDYRAPYSEALELFFNEYLTTTGDSELMMVCGLFFAFRGAVIANPVFYPDVSEDRRKAIFRFVNNVLDEEIFDVSRIDAYLRHS